MFSLISLPINLSGAIRACVVYQQLCFLHAMQDEDKYTFQEWKMPSLAKICGWLVHEWKKVDIYRRIEDDLKHNIHFCVLCSTCFAWTLGWHACVAAYKHSCIHILNSIIKGNSKHPPVLVLKNLTSYCSNMTLVYAASVPEYCSYRKNTSSMELYCLWTRSVSW